MRRSCSVSGVRRPSDECGIGESRGELGDLAATRPDIAAAGRRLLYTHGIGLGFLATVRADGGPRVHPICPVLTESGIYGMIIPGPKLNDLRRDPRYALHGETIPPPNQDDAFYVSGMALEVADPIAWEEIALQTLTERSTTAALARIRNAGAVRVPRGALSADPDALRRSVPGRSHRVALGHARSRCHRVTLTHAE